MVLADPVALSRLAAKAGRAALRTGKVPPRLAWRRWVLNRGYDDTAASTARSTLVVAPHPDDETIGCGATIARKRAAGSAVDVVVVTDGRHSHASPLVTPTRLAELREGESRTACEVLGVAAGSVRFLGYEEGTLWRCLDDLVATLATLIDAVRPDEILVTSEHDWHDDHQAVNAAVRRAAAATGYGGHLGAFPVWFWADGPWTTHPTAGLAEQLRTLGPAPDALRLARPWLVSTDGFVAVKRAAFACYSSQTTNLTGEPTWAVFPDGWIDPFCGPAEPFFALTPDAHAGAERLVRPAAAAAPTIAAVDDDFADERGLGAVIGTRSGSGALRQGVDAEGTVGIDGGELRFAALARPGWSRQGLAYGPFDAAPGLTLAAQILNGHNSAQSNTLPQGRKALARRLAAEFPHVELDPPHIDDNLAVGFFPSATPDRPTDTAHAMIMHAGGVLNGELRARVGGGTAELVRAVQEVPLRYVVALREGGAVYYLASLPGAHGAAGLPLMRPVAVDATPAAGLVWAGVHQAVHGEVGHDIATRVAAVRAQLVPDLAGWGAGTLAADRLTEHAAAAAWRPGSGALQRGPRGTTSANAEPAWAWIELDSAAGLVHVVVETAPVQGTGTLAGLLFRLAADGSGWRVEVSRDRAELAMRDGQGDWEPVASCAIRLDSGLRTSLQVLDDGTTVAVNLGGTALFGWISDRRHATNRGVGVLAGPLGSAVVADFEAFGRTVPIPAELELGEPWYERGTQVVFDDRFAGPAGPLDGPGPLDQGGWQRMLGTGRFEVVEGGGCIVVASPSQPNPGRTLYTRPWPHPDLADLEVVFTPPGTGQGQGHGSRAGVTFVQDPDNLLVLNAWLDDTKDHDGSSLSLFFRLDGRERMYDAVWTNVGRRIRWGHTSVLRACFDGSHLVAWLDGEPVLWRRISDIRPNIAPLRINRVGLVANREWGDDTGTTFHRVTARRR